MKSRSVTALAATAALATTLVASTAMQAGAAPNPNSVAKLTQAVNLDGVMSHLEALQEVADDNGGNRAAGLPGYRASVDYVVEQLEAAGYDPTVQEFLFDYFEENSELQRLSPDPTTYVNGDDFPAELTVPLRKRAALRYGENPHQAAALYERGCKGGSAHCCQLLEALLSRKNSSP